MIPVYTCRLTDKIENIRSLKPVLLEYVGSQGFVFSKHVWVTYEKHSFERNLTNPIFKLSVVPEFTSIPSKIL